MLWSINYLVFREWKLRLNRTQLIIISVEKKKEKLKLILDHIIVFVFILIRELQIKEQKLPQALTAGLWFEEALPGQALDNESGKNTEAVRCTAAHAPTQSAASQLFVLSVDVSVTTCQQSIFRHDFIGLEKGSGIPYH